MTHALAVVPRWGRFHAEFSSDRMYADPLRDVAVSVRFTAPGGRDFDVPAFWDGDHVWRVRFSPTEEGAWTYRTTATVGEALDGVTGSFTCGPARGSDRFAQHGPVRVAPNGRHLEHADGTPFLWLGDTAWNGPLLSNELEWAEYVSTRVEQRFTAVQWVATHWLASSRGDRDGRLAFEGNERIRITPEFFQRLDARVEALAAAGLLSVPVLLWAAEWSTPDVNAHNPGLFLPEADAILLARYMVARWAAYPTVWILPGDGPYLGEKAERWRRIGRAVFGAAPHAPTMLHPAGMQWHADTFRDESWLDLIGYQSGHGDDQDTLAWLVAGPVAATWATTARPILNLEPPYEDHIAYHSRNRIDAAFVRRAMYWSLLNAPTAGVTYGAHGVWGWDQGGALTEGHPGAGTAQSWRSALRFPAANQVRHIAALFSGLPWWRLAPDPALLAAQPGEADRRQFILAAATPDAAHILVYAPAGAQPDLSARVPVSRYTATWFDPRTGDRRRAATERPGTHRFCPPTGDDWVLWLTRHP